MPRILLIKTSSMGDVVHNLPVVADILGVHAGARIDWVVEEGFAAIPGLHPGVGEVIPVAIRRWRKAPFDRETRREFGRFRDRLRSTTYDAVIDTQGLFKSAVLARMAPGVRHGLDWRSSREPLRPFYHHTHSVPWSMHAVARNRLLASRALGYALPQRATFGIHARDADLSALRALLPELSHRPFAVLLHATSAANKEWPEQNWIELGNQLQHHGLAIVLPFGNGREQDRSRRIATGIAGAIVPPALTLDHLAALLSTARTVAGVDTGLTHLSAALERRTVGLYCATDPAATGLYGSASAVNLGGTGGGPGVGEVAAAMLNDTDSR